MKNIRKYIQNSAMVAAILVTCSAPPARSVDLFSQGCTGNTDSVVCTESRGGRTFNSIITDVINLIYYVIGVVAVVVIIIGGLRYVASGGDATAVKAAKNTVLYGVIGLVVASLAYGIVYFVTGYFD